MTEKWKDVPGYEGKYQVSDLGRVRSLPHKVRVVAHGTEATRMSPGRILRPGPKSSGHLTVSLGRHNSQQVHQLVMRAFVGPRPEGMEVCHNDGDPTNNALDNLRYDTRAENIRDAYRQRGYKGKMDPETVREVRTALAKGRTGRDISRALGVSENVISDIKLGRTFSWVN